MSRRTSCLVAASLGLVLAAAGCDDDHQHGNADGGGGTGGGAVAQTLFVGFGDGTIASYDIATGKERPGTITSARGVTDMQTIADGHFIANLSESSEILVADGASMQEIRRIPTSTIGGTRPVHGFITPTIAGKTYFVANNDGEPGMLASNTLRFVDLTPGGATYLTAVGEVALPGIGHHKDAFSADVPRVSVSNIADCTVALAVFDYANVAAPTVVKTFSPVDLDATLGPACASKAVSPHGAAYARAGKRGYHSLTGWGKILSIAQDADPPTVKLLPTGGSGSGYTKAGSDGRHVYALQNRPREGDAMKPGVDCQVGSLVVVDGMADAVVKEVPILHKGGGCTEKIVGTDAETVAPDNMKLSADGKTLYVATQGTPPAGSTALRYSDQQVVFDLADPASPIQKPSVPVGRHQGHRALAVSGDGKWLFVANGLDNSVTQIEIATGVPKTLPLKGSPKTLATWGSAEGPGSQNGPD